MGSHFFAKNMNYQPLYECFCLSIDTQGSLLGKREGLDWWSGSRGKCACLRRKCYKFDEATLPVNDQASLFVK
jgi:hypothetical protein